MIRPARRLARFTASLLLLPLQAAVPAAAWQFVEVAAEAGLDYEHGFGNDPVFEPQVVSGGIAAGDIDGDGWIDLYAVRGSIGPNLLFRNRRDGTFEEIGAAAGLDLENGRSTAPAFADLDGDGRDDLFLGGIAGASPRLFRNLGTVGSIPRFQEITAASGIVSSRDTFSSAFGDYDRDGDLDLFLAHWSATGSFSNHLWRNRGGGTFEPVDFAAGLAPFFLDSDWSFTPNFADLDDDGWPDLLIAGDFGTSRVFRNLGDGTFENLTDPVISDENGMGAAVGDYDGDGDFDWFVSSVWDPDGTAEGNWGVSGNRLYQNRGDGTFEDATEPAGVREGFWGWGSCFGDFDNDGDLDLFHTNGFPLTGAEAFHQDPSRLFVQQEPGAVPVFEERSADLGIDDTGQGRGVVCFDYDRDGDLDLLIAQSEGPPRLYRNELEPTGYLTVRVEDSEGRVAIGTRLELITANGVQVREIRGGSNYVSQNPPEAHFGLGKSPAVSELHIRWPDGEEWVLTDPPLDRLLLVRPDQLSPVTIPTLPPIGLLLLAVLLSWAGCRASRRRTRR